MKIEEWNERAKRFSKQAEVEEIIQEVKRSGKSFMRSQPQGDGLVLKMAYWMGDRLPRQKPIGFRGTYGLLFARRLPKDEKWLGVAVIREAEEYLNFKRQLDAEGWKIYIDTSRVDVNLPRDAPLSAIERVK